QEIEVLPARAQISSKSYRQPAATPPFSGSITRLGFRVIPKRGKMLEQNGPPRAHGPIMFALHPRSKRPRNHRPPVYTKFARTARYPEFPAEGNLSRQLASNCRVRALDTVRDPSPRITGK